MPVPIDLNARIALAKGWTYQDIDLWKQPAAVRLWYDPNGKQRGHPDYVGTLEGVAGLMRELQARRKPMSQWAWYWNEWKQRFVILHAAWRHRLFGRQVHAVFYSDIDHPGDCVGEAYLSIFEEAADASTE